MIYILQLDKPLGTHKKQSRYYIGYCRDDGCFNRRMKEHLSGNGSAFTRAAVDRGIGIKCVATMEGGRDLERRLKAIKNTPRILKNLERNWLWTPKMRTSENL